MAEKITVVIADDHPVFLRGLRMVIESEPAFRIVGEALNGAAALQEVAARQPHVLVLDVDMPGDDGFAVVRELQERRLAVPVIFLTMYEDEAIFNSALNLGVAGYMLKDSALADIVNGIKTVAAGHRFVTPRLASLLLKRQRRNTELGTRKSALEELSPSEKRVLRLVADQKTSKEIAAELFISLRTVEHHRANICAKLDLHGVNALLKFALDHKANLLDRVRG